jgi:hypothetical protein
MYDAVKAFEEVGEAVTGALLDDIEPSVESSVLMDADADDSRVGGTEVSRDKSGRGGKGGIRLSESTSSLD